MKNLPEHNALIKEVNSSLCEIKSLTDRKTELERRYEAKERLVSTV